ncbi:MAG: lipocalin family protein [Aestuariivirga sp.]
MSWNQTGWDWFSLHFESGEKLIGFRLRDDKDDFTSATWINASGSTDPLPPPQLRLAPLETESVTGCDIPVRLQLELPVRNLKIETEAINPSAWISTLGRPGKDYRYPSPNRLFRDNGVLKGNADGLSACLQTNDFGEGLLQRCMTQVAD